MKLKLLKRVILNKGALWLSFIKLLPITRKLDKNSIVLDCGANIGDITKKFAATGATVHAFEPDPLAFGILEKRFRASSNVILHNQGVWDKEADITLYAHKDQDSQNAAYTVSSSIVIDKINIDDSRGQLIHVIDLPEFIRQLGKRINVIKLDVEGAEIEILKKMLRDETYHLFDHMYVETHETKIPGHKEELKQIRELMERKKVTNIKLNWL
jgi:FkbM family methyltransferase